MCAAKVQLCFLLTKILVSGLVQPACAMRVIELEAGSAPFEPVEPVTVRSVEELIRVIDAKYDGPKRKVNLEKGSYHLNQSVSLSHDIVLVGGHDVFVTCAKSMKEPAFIQNCGSVHLSGFDIRNCSSAFRTVVPKAVTSLENLTVESLDAAVFFSSEAGNLTVNSSHFINNDETIQVDAPDVSLTILMSTFSSNDCSVCLSSARATVKLHGCTVSHEDFVLRIDEEDAKVSISNSTLQNNWHVVEVKAANATVILNASDLAKNRAGVHGRRNASDAKIILNDTNFSDSQALAWHGDRLSLDVQRCWFVGAPPSTVRYTLVAYSGGPTCVTVRNCTFEDVSTAMEFTVGVFNASLDKLRLQDVERGVVISEDRSRPARGDFVKILDRTTADTPCPHLIGKECRIQSNNLYHGDYFVKDCRKALRQQDFAVVLRKQKLIEPAQHRETKTHEIVDLASIYAASSVNLSNISVIRAHKGITIDGVSNVTFENFIVSESTFGVVVQNTFDMAEQNHDRVSFRNAAILGNSVGVQVLNNSLSLQLDADSNLFFNEKDVCYDHFATCTTRVNNKGAHTLIRKDPWLLHLHFNYHLFFLSVTYVAAEVLSMVPVVLQPKQTLTWKNMRSGKVFKRIILSKILAAFAWIGLFSYVAWLWFRFRNMVHLKTIHTQFRFIGWMSLRVLLLSAIARAAMPRLRYHIQVIQEISERNVAAEQVDRLLQSATDVDALKDLAKKHRELLRASEAGNSMLVQKIFSQMKTNCEEAITKITPFLKAIRLELESDKRGHAIFHIPSMNSLPFAEIPEELRRKDDGQVAAWLSRRAAWMRSTFERQLHRVMDRWADCASVSDALHKQYITVEQASKLSCDDLEPEAYPLRPLPHSRATSEHENGGLLMAPGVKEVERALVKGRKEYVGAEYVETPGVVYVTDWLRATLYSRDGLSLALAYFILENVFGGIVKAKAKLGDERLPDDQRIAILCVVNVKDDKIGFRMPCEVQLIPQDLLILKGIQHLLYEVARAEDPSEIVGHPIFVDFEDKDTKCATKTPM